MNESENDTGGSDTKIMIQVGMIQADWQGGQGGTRDVEGMSDPEKAERPDTCCWE